MPTPDRSERTFGETVRTRHRDPVAKRDRIQAAEAARVDRRIAQAAKPKPRRRPIEGLTSIPAAERCILECCVDRNGNPDYPRQTILLRTLKGWMNDDSITSDHRRKLIKFLKRWNRADA